QDIIGNTLAAKGFYEIMTNSLVSSNALSADGNEAVQMLNPLSSDLSVLRTSMLSSGLQTVGYNHNRQKTDLKLFEFGKTYHKIDGQYKEKRHLSLFISGDRNQNNWSITTGKTDFFYIKGIVESLFERLGIHDLETAPLSGSIYAEGLTCGKNGRPLASYGLVSKSILKKFDLKQDVFHADFDWDAILESI